MTGPEHPLHDRIQSYLDGRMGEDERQRFETELAVDPDARRELDAFRALGEAVRRTVEIPASGDLEAKLRMALDREDAGEPASPGGAVEPTRRGWLRWAATAAAVAAVGWLFLLATRQGTDAPAARPLPLIVAERMHDYDEGRFALQKETADHPALERFFAERGVEFPTRVLDLDMMSFRLVGGARTELTGRTTAAFVYTGPDDLRVLCQMYLGNMEELPPTADVREHNGIRFYSYQVDCVSMTFWREGDVICVLASMGDLEELVALAFAKAMAVQT